MLIFSVQWLEITGNPLFQGISFQKGFELNFKPLPRKPIAFISEKWSPFGVFGRKFAIQKRSLDDMVPPPPARVPRPAAPVFEHIEEIEEIGTGPLFIVPRSPVLPPAVLPPPPPVPKPVEEPKPLPPPLPVPLPIIVNELPPLPEKPHAVPPISTNMVIIQPTKVVNSHVTSSSGLYTDITRVESVKEHIDSAKPIPVEPKPPVPVPPVPPPVVEPVPPPPVPPPPVPPPPVSPPPAEPVPPPPAPIPPTSEEPLSPPPTPVPPPPPEPPKAPEPIPPHYIHKKEEKKKNKEILHDKQKKEIPLEGHKTEVLLKDSSLIKGSKMALQFGTVFLTLMAQFFDSARATIDQMTNPPPNFKE